MKRTAKLAAFVIAAFLPGAAFAAAPLPKTLVTAVSGDCNNADIRPGMTQLPNNRIAFGLNFENRSFQALDLTADGDETTASCDVSVEVEVPHGYRLQIDAFALEGYLRANGTNAVAIDASYDARHDSGQGDEFASVNLRLNPRAAAAEQDDRLTTGSTLGVSQGPWAAHYDLSRSHTEMMASDCGETLILHSALTLHAMKAADLGGPTNIALFKEDQSGLVEWGWRLIPCDGGNTSHDFWFQGPWHSRYSVNHQWVQAGLNIFGERGGQYTTVSWTGDLSVESYDDNEVTGTWRAQGECGWFRFHRGQDGRSFMGSWGKEQGFEQGSWMGER